MLFFPRRRPSPPPRPVPMRQAVGGLMRDAGLLLLGAALASKALGLRLSPTGLSLPAAEAPDPSDPRSFDRLEPGRGRAASRPFDIPKPGWGDIIWRVWKAFGGDRLGATAAGVAFYVVLGVFPGLSAFISLYGLFFDPATAREQLQLFHGLLPPDALDLLGEQMMRIAGAPSPGLGLAFFVSLALALWSANGAVKALFDGLNVAYHETEKRSIVRFNLYTLGFTLGGIVFILTVVSAVVLAPLAFAVFGVDGAQVFEVARWPLLFVINVVVLQIVYRYGPSRQQPRWRWVTLGSVLAAAVWMAASAGFSWYLQTFARYQTTYGSLGAFAGFMVWTWLSVLILLLGAELNAAMEHQTAEDTTTGAALPLGQRGALVADTIGPRRGSKAAERYTLDAAQEESRRNIKRDSKKAIKEGRAPPGTG